MTRGQRVKTCTLQKMDDEGRSWNNGAMGYGHIGHVAKDQYNASMVPIYWTNGVQRGQPWPQHHPNGQNWPHDALQVQPWPQGHVSPDVVPQQQAVPQQGHVWAPQVPQQGHAWAPQVPHQGHAWNPQVPQQGHAWNPQVPQQGHAWNPQVPQQGHAWAPQVPQQGHAWNTQVPQQGHAWAPQVPQQGHAWAPQVPQQGHGWPAGLPQGPPPLAMVANQNLVLPQQPQGALQAEGGPQVAASAHYNSTGARPKRRHFKSNVHNFVREAGGRRRPKCVFCSMNGEEAVWHVFKDDNGDVLCPVLSAYKCRLCGATGKAAHTLKYCPKNKVTKGDPVAAGLPPGLMPSDIKMEDIY